METNKFSNITETEYVETLKLERHLYKWCLSGIGKMSEQDAEMHANNFYKYEDDTNIYRDLVFHDTSWHWAMLKILGDHYWVKYPNYKAQSEDYNKEYINFTKKHSPDNNT